MSQRLTHDQYYLKMLDLVAARSTCVRRAVGAIIVDQDFHVLSTGYNGVPRHHPHCIEEPCLGAEDPRGDTTRCFAVHAEINAIMQCADINRAYCMYVSCTPCFECAKAIANTGIRRIVATEVYTGAGYTMLQVAGVKIEIAKVLNP